MRITFTAPLLAAAALTLAACGGDAAEADGDTDAGTEETATASEGDGKDAASADAGTEADVGSSGKDGADVEQIDIDFGTDDGDWANDDECDDPRFEGPGMTDTPLLDDDIRNDATDCREAFERGELSLRG